MQEESALVGNDLPIVYLLPHLPSPMEEASLTALYPSGLLEIGSALACVSLLPTTLAESRMDGDNALLARIGNGMHSCIPIETTSLAVLLERTRGQMRVVISSTEAIRGQVASIVESEVEPILHIDLTVDRSEQDIRAEFGTSLDLYSRDLLAYWEGNPEYSEVAAAARQWIESLAPSNATHEVEVPEYGHNLVVPNELAIESLGGRFTTNAGKLTAITNGPYFEALRKSVDHICEVRSGLFSRIERAEDSTPYDLIVACPSTTIAWKGKKAAKLARSLGGAPELRELLRQLSARDTFSFSIRPKNLRAFLEDGPAKAILAENADEMLVFTGALAIRASSSFCPVLRIPMRANGLQKELRGLIGAHRATSANNPSRTRKISTLARKYSQELASGLPDWVIRKIQSSRRVKFISDAPLELMNIDGQPLALSHETSRIAATPGGVMFSECVARSQVKLPLAMFERILVISSFRSDDPIRTVLPSVLERTLGDRQPSIGVLDRVEVKNRNELVAALQAFKGAIMVFDGHGSHDEERDIGLIHLADEAVDPWDLRGIARVPPIVVLSSCDTHRFGVSHATSATGFLFSGAKTVLGTSLEVTALHAASFVARIVMRVQGLLGELVARNPVFRWHEFLPIVQKRQHLGEVVLALAKQFKLDLEDEGVKDAQLRAGFEIEARRMDWFSRFIDKLAESSGVQRSDLARFVDEHAFLSDALLYTQFGCPEDIRVVQSEAD